jgi:hypothetical protein
MTLKLVYPALAMIFWVFVVLGILFVRRQAAFAAKEVRLADVAVSTERYPERARLAAANFANQFEMPVLFFGILMLAMEVAAATYLMAGLAWAFVATRVVHTLIHTGSNNVKQRAGVFGLGCLILFAMWLHVVIVVV